MIFRIFYISVGFSLCFLCINAQQKYTQEYVRVQRNYKMAKKLIEQGNYGDAIQNLKDAIHIDSSFIDAYDLLAEIYRVQKKYTAIKDLYRKCAEINGDSIPKVYVNYIYTLKFLEEYDNVITISEYALALPAVSEDEKALITRYMESARFAKNAKAHPVPFQPVNMGAAINSKHPDFLPSLTADQKTIIFTVRKPRPPRFYGDSPVQDDFYISKKTNGKWSEAAEMPINTPQSEGAQSVSADGNFLFFTACERNNGYGECDIYMSRRYKNRWVAPVNLGRTVNTKFWDSQPSISPDGKTLYFSSKRPGGFGKEDIWMTSMDSNGNFTAPVNIGAVINTSGAEQSPFIHPDNQTLYFASDGHPGMGSGDIFMSRKDSAGNWSEPVNLGYPINTRKEEGSLMVNATGDKAYIAAERQGGFGGLDIYAFELYEKARPTPVIYLAGRVLDTETNQPLEADIEILDLKTGKTIVKSKSNKENGKYFVVAPVKKDYALNIAKSGYLFFSENLALAEADENTVSFEQDVYLPPVKNGAKVIMNNIFFAFDSYELLPESKAELTKLLIFIRKHPGIKIEISGHSDDKGTAEYNMELSEKRAKAVYDYLLEHKVSPEMVTFKGYGMSQPLSDNDTEEGRAMNRRTECKVVESF